MAIFTRATRQEFDFKANREYYWLIGDEKNPPLLIISGLTGTHDDLLDFSRNLRNNYFLIIPELPGWGKSDRLDEKLTLTNYAQYLQKLVDHLKIDKLSILGHCMGAALAIEMTHSNQNMVNKLILVSPPYEEGRIGYKLMNHLTDMGKRTPHFLHPIFYFWHNKYLNLITDFFIMQFKSFRKKISKLKRGFKTRTKDYEENFEESWTDLLHYNFKKVKELKMPINLIFGSKDILVPISQAQKFHELIPQASLDFIESAGHVAPVETPDTLASLVMKRLQNI